MNDTTYYTTTSDYGTSSAPSAAATAGIILFVIVVFLAFYALAAWLIGRIFKKAGVPAWIAWVPFYSNWKLLEIGGQQGFWAVLAIIPVVNYVSAVFVFISMYNIGLKLGKSGAFLLWGIFFPIVWYIWLAFDKSTWNDSLGAARVDAPTASTAPVA